MDILINRYRFHFMNLFSFRESHQNLVSMHLICILQMTEPLDILLWENEVKFAMNLGQHIGLLSTQYSD
jgi:hypothetical protein